MENFSSLVALLAKRAETQPDERAYIFLSDRGAEEAVLTFRQLHDAAQALAARLTEVARPGDRALLVFPPGLEFIVAFFGCLIARVIAVPMMMPRRQSARDASAAIMANCEPAVALTNAAFAIRQDLQARFSREGLQWLAVDLEPAPVATGTADLPQPGPQDIAFLQYTSGSTSDPKGVAVSHANLLANLEMIRLSLGNTSQSTYVNWVPLYHDMGLILNALEALYVGALCVLMAPNAFMQRPLNWLRAIQRLSRRGRLQPQFRLRPLRQPLSRRPDAGRRSLLVEGRAQRRRAGSCRNDRAVHRDLCRPRLQSRCRLPGLWHGGSDLADLRRTPRRGSRDAHGQPVRRCRPTRSTRRRIPADVQTLVGCGRALVNERIAIVDPDSCTRLPPDQVGEIWVNGPNVARAYWRNPEATRTGLSAQIAGERRRELAAHRRSRLPRCGGRIVHHRPDQGPHHRQGHQSLSAGYRAHRAGAHPALRANCGAAFSVPDERGEETLVIVQEIERTERNRIDAAEMKGLIREGVTDQHELFARHIVLIRPGALPKTTSGKIQRSLARRLWLERQFEDLAAGAD